MNHHGPGDVPGVIKQVANRVRGARAIAVVCSFGPPGSGKSDGNLFLGSEVQKLLGSGPMTVPSLNHQLRFKPKDFPAMAQTAGNKRAVFCDEGSGEGANKMRQMGKDNVEVGIDLDACREREQPVFWANPYKRDLTPQVLKHMTWCLEWNLDHSVTFWEADPVDPIFGKEPFIRDRFTVDPFPFFGDYCPDVHAAYKVLKDQHSKGVDVVSLARQERQLADFSQAIARVLR